jgi:hypothetical protein
MGVAGVALGVVCVAGALLWGTVWNRCRIAPRRSSAEHRQPRWRALVWFRWLMEWDKHWVAPYAHEEEEGAARIPLQAPETLLSSVSIRPVLMWTPNRMKKKAVPHGLADESEATLPHPAGAVPAVPAAAADEPDLEEAVDVNADSDLRRASERVAAARNVLRLETEIADKSQSDHLFMPVRSDTAPPAPLTHRKRKKKRRAPVAARSTSPEPEVPDDDL